MSNERYKPVLFGIPDPPRPARKIVTVDDAAAKHVLEIAGSLNWPDQADQIRRANSILLSRVMAKIANPDPNDNAEDLFSQLQKLSSIAKQWTQEERQGGGPNAEEPTPAQLMKAVKK